MSELHADKTKFARTSGYRNFLLASAAGVALIAAASVTGLTELAPWTSHAHAAAVQVNQPAVAGGPSFADLIDKVEPAVVSIKTELAEQRVALNGQPGQPGHGVPMAQGAGFFVSADGYIVTANHVVANAKSVQITTSEGVNYPAKIVGTDRATDVAVLKVDTGPGFTFVKFAEEMPRVGDWVVAIGNPYGLATTATAGIVSALARDIGDRTFDGYLQIDAPINSGNSGGPTFDVHGNVVGINDAIFSPSGGSVGIGFDIPATTAKGVVETIRTSGHVTRAWLGVQVQDVTRELADGLSLKDAAGALVSEPQANSPAAKAGVTAGDVIVAVNGKSIADARGLAQSVAGLAVGASVKLDVIHSGQSRSVDVTLGEAPAQQ